MHSNRPHSRSELFDVEDCGPAAVSCDHLGQEYQGTGQLFAITSVPSSDLRGTPFHQRYRERWLGGNGRSA